MKKVAFLYCEEAVFGYFSPISILTEANLQRAIGLLNCGACDFLYIAINHFPEKNKEKARNYFEQYFNDFYGEVASRVYVSFAKRCYASMFTDYLSIFKDEVHLSILANISRKNEIEKKLINASIETENKLPPVFTSK
ncbi:MAG: hypothetical protein WCI36_04025 [bacterium]